MKKNYIKVNGIIEAETSIFHGGDEKTGSSPVLRRIDLYVPEQNDYVSIPYIHGNAVRGRLRRIAMRDFCSMIDYNFSEIDNSYFSYWVDILNSKKKNMDTKKVKLYHALFAGGALESTDEKESGVIDLDFRKLMTDALPLLSLFGGAFGNQMIAGKMDVGMLFPICKEREIYLSEIGDCRKSQNVRCFTGSEFITRRDDLRADRKEDEQATQMKVEREVFVPGTAFDHEFILKFANNLEKSCFRHMIELWMQNPTIGGNASSGSGKLKTEYDLNELPKTDIYIDYVEQNKENFPKLFDEIMKRI